MWGRNISEKQSIEKRIVQSLFCLCLGGILVLFAQNCFSAPSGLGVKPSGRPTEKPLPSLEDQKPKPTPPMVLPTPVTPKSERVKSDVGISVYVKKIEVTGSTVFSTEELEAITRPYINQKLTTEDLDSLRQELTVLYINKGYINSGAIIPDQQMVDGVIRLKIIEGDLTTIEVEGNRWFTNNFIKKRIALGAAPPLNISSLQERLQLLQQNQLIKRLNTTLKPGLSPGESVLNVEIEEQQPFIIQLGFDNYQSPTVGAEEGWVTVADRNLTGHGDTVSFGYGASEGAHPQLDVSYSLPFTAYDTTLTTRYRKNNFDVVESPFDDLDVESKSEIYEVGVRQPFHRSLNQEFALSLTGERLKHKTRLLGEPFSFSPGAENGKAVVTALRFAQEWIYHTQEEVIAARSQLSFGIDALNATIHSGDTPDSDFIVWLGQFQWAKVISPWGAQLIFHSELQLSNNSLLPLEQIAVGGRYSVRGYRENQLVRDQGFITSLESRLPLVQNQSWADYLQIAPFVDFGKAWNKDRKTPSVKSISSAGLGLRWGLTWKTAGRTLKPQFEVYWGIPLRNIDSTRNDLQDSGIHLQFLIAGF